MKKIIFIVAINFLISNCSAEDPPSNAMNSFLSKFGVSLKRSPSQYEQLRSDTNPNAESEPDPLDVLIVKLDGKFVSGTIGNLLLLGQVIRGDEFVDVLLACPKNDEEPLAIENNYISIVKKSIHQANISLEEINRPKEGENNTPEQNTAPIKKINEDVKSLTPETEKFWIQALNDMKNVKCRKPIVAHLMEYPSRTQFKFYVGGFEIIMDMHEDLVIPEFKKTSNRKYRWFWSFTIVFTEPDRNVVCVYQEIQYNKDTYSPQINDDFSNHDLGNDMMFSGMNISELYEIDNQKKVFLKLFKDENERKNYFDPAQEKFLVRVHLAPLNGFVSPVTRQFGKSYGNIAPMWKSIRNGAWRRVEEYVNILSHVLVDIIVVTGTYGTLNLDGKNVFLADDEKVPVPLAFWKLVAYGSELDNLHGILIITSNNPFKDIGNIICNANKCMRFGWGHIQEDDIAKGRTICCNFFPEILQHIPILIGLQPPEILNLIRMRPFVEIAWAYNELGEETTLEQRNAIWEKLQLYNNVFNEELSPANEVVEEDLKLINKNKDEKVPQITNELQAVPLIQRHTVF